MTDYEETKQNKNKFICFSLWCQKDKLDPKKVNETPNMYIKGTLKNLELSKEIYSDWKFRFYINNTVPQEIQTQILQMGGDLVDMTNSRIPGMYWRFLAIDDPNVDIFIVRDVDSRINLREQLAVQEWLESDAILHIMRDHPHHYYPILGGMWGFKNYLEPQNIRTEIKREMNRFIHKKKFQFKRMDDMKFLELLYNKYVTKALVHDEFFNFSNKNRKNFPQIESCTGLPYGKSGKYYHFVGEIYDENNQNPYHQRDIDLYANYRTIMKNHWTHRIWQNSF